MSNPIAAPTEADALHRLAQAMNRVHLPATLLRLLLALLAILTGNKAFASQYAAPPCRTWRTSLRDWQFSPTGETIDDLAPVLSPGALCRLRQQRAWRVRRVASAGRRQVGAQQRVQQRVVVEELGRVVVEVRCSQQGRARPNQE